MAQEISVTISSTLANPVSAPTTGAQLKGSFSPGTVKVTQNLAKKFEQVFDVTTSDGALTISGITTLGWCSLLNLSALYVVKHGPASGGALVPYGQLNPGEPATFRLVPGTTVRMQ